MRIEPPAASLIRAARTDVGLTQGELARRAGIAQSNLAALESGRRRASREMLARILRAADYRPSLALEREAPKIRAAAAALGLDRPLVIGSVIRGEDHADSDIDLVVDGGDGVGLVALASLAATVEELTGFPADVLSARGVAASGRGRHLLETAVPL